MASYPGSIKSFSARSAGQTVGSAHINDIQDEISAVETGLLSGLAHAVTISTGGLTVSTGSVNIGGPSSLATVQVNGASTFAGAATFSSGVTVSSGGLTLSTGNATFGQDVSVAGKVTSTLQLGNQLRLSVALSTLSGGSTAFDNVDFGSSAGLVFISGNSTAISITGITGGTHGRVLYLVNAMTGTEITLQADDAGSSADCRMRFASNTDKGLAASGSAMLVYSTVTGFWYGLASRV